MRRQIRNTDSRQIPRLLETKRLKTKITNEKTTAYNGNHQYMTNFVSDVIEYFVPYKMSKASDPMNIAERQYASAATIQFTTFTSCIGVIAKEGGTLTAAHLVVSTGKDHVCNANDIAKVLGRLPKKPDAVTIVGCIDVWENQANGQVLVGAFQKLTGSFQERLKKDYRRDGTYGAEIVDNEISVFSV
jgi:hypothetical protein